MSYDIKEKDCEQSDGDDGEWILSYTDKKNKNRKNCHTEIQNVLSQISSIEGIFPESNNTLKITRSQLKNLIKEEMKESLSRHQSELSYSHTNPPESKKALQKSYWKAHRGPAARADIESQIGSMDVGNEDDRTIGDIVPIGYDEWESKKDIDKKRREELPHGGFDTEPEYRSEAISYLKELALNVAEGTVAMSEEDIAALDILTNDAFGWSFSYSVTGHNADFSASDSRDEYYDDVEAGVYGEPVREDHERELREAIRLIIQEKILPGARISRSGAGASPEKVKEFLRETGLQSDYDECGQGATEHNNTSDLKGDMINHEEKLPAGSLSENRLMKLAGLLKD